MFLHLFQWRLQLCLPLNSHTVGCDFPEGYSDIVNELNVVILPEVLNGLLLPTILLDQLAEDVAEVLLEGGYDALVHGQEGRHDVCQEEHR